MAVPLPRRSLRGWALLAVLVILGSYLLTLALAIACFYFSFTILEAATNLTTLLLFLGGAAISLSMIWSLIPRHQPFRAPGPRLDPEREPRLFTELENIAKAFREPMPADVYLAPDVNAFVTERGGTLGFGSSRVMGIGLPLLRVLTLSQFRAVVAHEFGHYYGGDTRMGPWVYKARQAMLRTLTGFHAHSISTQVVRFSALAALARNLIVAILVWYWKVFMRATTAVSRRLEFRADELACWFAGSPALVDGLCAITRGTAAGYSFWQSELAPALQAGYLPPVAEGFGLFLSSRGVAQATSAFLDAEVRKTTSDPYNTHPPLGARLDAARSYAYPAEAGGDACAINLIGHLEELELRLLETALPQLKTGGLNTMPWDRLGPEVYVPGWRRFTAEYKAVLEGLTAAGLPEAAKDVRRIGARMRDPKGMLLTHEQRAGRATALLWMALAVAMIDHGWVLRAQPGESYLEHEGLPEVRPAAIVAGLQASSLTADDWRKQCEEAGIAQLRLDGEGASGK